MSSTPKTPLPGVLLHGWGLHAGIWAPLADALPDRRVLALDLPGYRDAPSVVPYTAVGLAGSVAAAAPPQAVAIGWSLGAMVALAWAATAPGQVRALVVVAGTPAFVRRPDWPHGMAAETLADFGAALATDYRAGLLRFLALQARGGEAPRTVIGELRARVFEHGEPALQILQAGLELLAGDDLRPLLDRVRCPTLVVHGGRDTLCRPEGAGWLADHLPNGRLALHPAAAHAPFLSHPQWFAECLRDFLAEVDR